jgi:autophagy-related protein 5
MSTYGTTRHLPSQQGFSSKDRATDYHTTLFRRLSWDGTVPLEIRIDSKELPANSDRGLECYYMQAPRVSYLPLVLPEVRRFFMDIVFEEGASKELKDEDWWFETAEGTLLKWWVFEFIFLIGLALI